MPSWSVLALVLFPFFGLFWLTLIDARKPRSDPFGEDEDFDAD